VGRGRSATLIDLMLGGHLYLDSGWAYRDYRPGEARSVPDPIAAAVLHQITAEPGVPVGDILRSASADLGDRQPHPYTRLYQRTLAELVAADIVVEQQRTFRRVRYVAADESDLAAHSGLLKHRVVYHHRDRDDPRTDCLCALAWALGVHTGLVTTYDPARTEKVLRGITDGFADVSHPYAVLTAVPYLAGCVHDAVGDLATAPF
jgi:hypothetical protein